MHIPSPVNNLVLCFAAFNPNVFGCESALLVTSLKVWMLYDVRRVAVTQALQKFYKWRFSLKRAFISFGKCIADTELAIGPGIFRAAHIQYMRSRRYVITLFNAYAYTLAVNNFVLRFAAFNLYVLGASLHCQ